MLWHMIGALGVIIRGDFVCAWMEAADYGYMYGCGDFSFAIELYHFATDLRVLITLSVLQLSFSGHRHPRQVEHMKPVLASSPAS